MTMGEKISTRRKEKGWSQSELAEKIFVSDKTISKWETNRGKPEITILKRLASVLDMSVDELLEEDDAPGETTPPPVKRTFMEKLSEPIVPMEYHRNDIKIVWIFYVALNALFLVILDLMLANIINVYGLQASLGGIVFLQVALMVLIVLTVVHADTDLRYLLGMLLVSILLSLYSLFTTDSSFFGYILLLVAMAMNVLFAMVILGYFTRADLVFKLQILEIGLILVGLLISLADRTTQSYFLEAYRYHIVQNFSSIIAAIGSLFLISAVTDARTRKKAANTK